MKIIEKLEEGKVFLDVEKSIYHHKSVLEATYKFTDKFYIQIESIGPENYRVCFSPKQNDVNLDYEIKRFCNELIDQQVRFNLNQSNSSIKEMIIRKAFFPFEDEKE